MHFCFIRKIFFFIIFIFTLNACAPLVPDNYLGPTTINSYQKINGKWIKPQFISVSPELLSTPEGQALLSHAMKPQSYRVGAYDNLNIIIWGHPELSTVSTASTSVSNVVSSTNGGLGEISSASAAINPAILVETDGTIFYPYVGHLHVSGLTTLQIQNKITSRLSRYLKSPQVSVQVAKFRNRHAYVLGEVKMPGMQPLTDKPLALMEAISSAGGINTDNADPSHIYLIRGSYKRPEIYWLNAQTPQSLIIAEQFPLQENDIVYVSSASLSGVNHFLNQVLPSLSTYVIAKRF